MILEMHRVLKPGGKLVLVQPYIEQSLVETMLEEIGYKQIGYLFISVEMRFSLLYHWSIIRKTVL